jgi:predicted acylesterase/phospholipase RssA
VLLESADSDTRPVRVLAVDGGGIRGIVPSVFLIELQRRLSRPISDCFDVIAGTSTGGMLAAALCTPGAGDAPRYTPEDILGFYTKDCRQIFHRSAAYALLSAGGWLRPKYPTSGIRDFLKDRFGDLALSQVRRLLMLVTYDVQRRRPYVFCSARALERAHHDFLLRDACRASTAAPTYFAPAGIEDRVGDLRHFVDGGVCSNDPTLPAFVEADQQFPGRPVIAVSLGTGAMMQATHRPRARHWGAFGWATRILDVLTEGQSGMSENCLSHLVRSRARAGSAYLRLQPAIPDGLGRMDDTSTRNLKGLEDATRRYCEMEAARLDDIARLLAEPPA